jgi:hypothetical protein
MFIAQIIMPTIRQVATTFLLILCQCPALRASTGIECIKEIELPHYSFVARGIHGGGTVRAIVKIGENGRPTNISTLNAEENLAEEVRDTLTDGTSYLESCKGKHVELFFTFRLEGKPTGKPLTTTRFQPPNRFIIISEPQTPHFYYFPK